MSDRPGRRSSDSGFNKVLPWIPVAILAFAVVESFVRTQEHQLRTDERMAALERIVSTEGIVKHELRMQSIEYRLKDLENGKTP